MNPTRCALIACLLALSAAAASAAPHIDPVDDARYLGTADNILFWTAHEKVAGFRNMDKVGWTRPVRRGQTVRELPLDLRELGDVVLHHGDGRTMTVDEYVVEQDVAGLLVIHDGRIVVERYELGNGPATPWQSFSVAKSVSSLLVGAALRDGYIESVDEKVSDYLPRLKGTPYDDVTLHNLLQMASGVAWDETYSDPEADINRVTWGTLDLYRYLAGMERAAEPGTLFNYNTAETNLVGTMLRSAIGNNLSTYLEEKIWKPFGMEYDASWSLTEPGGGEFGGCCLHATLRDYGRLGLFALEGGRLADGTPVLADGWMDASVSPSKPWDGYGYQWWLAPNDAYRASGIFGQAICVHPRENVVVALHSAREAASDEDDWIWQARLCDALAAAAADG